MVDESRARAPRETGGILVGRIEGAVTVVVHAVGPGPAAVHGSAAFRRDGAYAQEQLDALYARSAGTLDYVGEWHSHVAPFGPSRLDGESMAWIARNPAYDRPWPVLVICRPADGPEWELAAFAWTGAHLTEIPLEIAP